MPLVIDGVKYYRSTEITSRLSVTRQTLWRWRSSGKIPYGHRFRGKQVVFTELELKEIEEYSNRIEPLHIASPQLTLFSNNWELESSERR
jgi:predicted DNA-binding transcriptional regulator AlpA